jgi:hypothetical protein
VQCLETTSCGITQNHVSLCTAISNALASQNQVANQSCLNSEPKEEIDSLPSPSPNEEISDLENEMESEEERQEIHEETEQESPEVSVRRNEEENNEVIPAVEENTPSPPEAEQKRLSPGPPNLPIPPVRRGSESQLDDPLSFLRRKDGTSFMFSSYLLLRTPNSSHQTSSKRSPELEN